jgi:predicted ester cyclase
MPAMSTQRTNNLLEQNKLIFQRFQAQVLNCYPVADRIIAECVTPDFIDHSDRLNLVRGVAGVQQRLAVIHSSFAGYWEETTKLLAERDYLAVMYTMHAHHVAPFLGIPATNRKVTVRGIRIVRMEGGKVAELWAINDYLAIAAQLGAEIEFTRIPTGGETPEELTAATDRRSRTRAPREAVDFAYQIERITGATDEIRRNKETLLKFQRDVFNAQDWRVETLARYLKPNIIDHNAFAGDPPGLEGVRHRFSAWQAAFDDAEEAYLAMVGEGDTLAVLYDLHAVHRGDFLGVRATSDHVVIPGIEVLRFEDSMMAEHWGIYDFLVTAREIGTRLVLKPASLVSVA